MKFTRTEKSEQKLLEQAFLDEKRVIRNAAIDIDYVGGKLKAYCRESGTYLQFPRALRDHENQRFIADVVEVIRTDHVTKYYRVVKGSIREMGSDEVVG
jgi:hypothetical protein